MKVEMLTYSILYSGVTNGLTGIIFGWSCYHFVEQKLFQSVVKYFNFYVTIVITIQAGG